MSHICWYDLHYSHFLLPLGTRLISCSFSFLSCVLMCLCYPLGNFSAVWSNSQLNNSWMSWIPLFAKELLQWVHACTPIQENFCLARWANKEPFPWMTWLRKWWRVQTYDTCKTECLPVIRSPSNICSLKHIRYFCPFLNPVRVLTYASHSSRYPKKSSIHWNMSDICYLPWKHQGRQEITNLQSYVTATPVSELKGFPFIDAKLLPRKTCLQTELTTAHTHTHTRYKMKNITVLEHP